MSGDMLWTYDIADLLKWILEDEKKGHIFGVSRDLFFVPPPKNPFKMRRYGRVLETPLGVAAGPQTQLSQNIVTAWLTGARYIELKTIQVLDELTVTKPCIDMADEGYNCEWSQELKLERSFDEYLNAWILIHLLKDRFGWGDREEPGFIFNMSVGYNLEGIKSPPVRRFLDRMGDCGSAKAEKIGRLARFYPRAGELDIPDRISDNITISTMHGCPPDEVEKIGRHFIRERGYHTTIKLNPTLLGPEKVRGILNDRLGYPVRVPDLAFEHDLKYSDGVALIKSLLKEAEEAGVAFNLKLTNTLETENREQNLPQNEGMVYMSGRALHPLSVNLAAELQDEFKGGLDISFSAGLDCFNAAPALAAGLAPLTVCSDLLKPGGYGRLSQYLEELLRAFEERGAGSVEEYILAVAGGPEEVAEAGFDNLFAYAARVADEDRYAKAAHPFEGIKTERELDTFDCASAPCMENCPAGQEIPRYLDFTARGETAKAFRTILATNPLPHVQGLVCDRQCRLKCTRLNYDQPLLIREIKRFAAETHQEESGVVPARPNGLRAAIIGAGPSGLSCAHYLALAGFRVDLYEIKSFPGGMAADAIPPFRLDRDSLEKDIRRILSLGVRFHPGQRIGAEEFARLRESNDFVYIAVGAQKSLTLDIPGIRGRGVIDQLSFLSAVDRGRAPELGPRVAVVGGGNSALDAARTAKRLVGEEGEVTIFYRRTENEMPADREEILAALEEGIDLQQLCAPERVILEDGRVTGFECSRMVLGEPDASGRPRPLKLECSEFTIPLDSLIPAIGQRVVLDFLPGKELAVDPETLKTGLKGIFAGGDAVRGASSLIKAIADGQKAARAILAQAGLKPLRDLSPAEDRKPDWKLLRRNQGRRVPAVRVPAGPQGGSEFALETDVLEPEAARSEAARCLQCDIFCNVCTTVCPNRANLAVEIEPLTYPVQAAYRDGDKVRIWTLDRIRVSQHFQILNLADFCNECGNCATFCPTKGAPYLDKPRFHLSRESYEADARGYFFRAPGSLEFKQDGTTASLTASERGFVYETGEVKVFLEDDLSARKVVFKNGGRMGYNLSHAAEMAVLFRIAEDTVPLAPSSGRRGGAGPEREQ